MVKTPDSRGFRNNNPLNIRYDAKNQWDHQTGQDAGGYAVFDDPVYGMRAGLMLLTKYQAKYKLLTVLAIIKKWAPPEDNNDPIAYATIVADALGISYGQEINVRDPAIAKPMLEAMIDVENKGKGHPYTDAQLDKALRLAGIDSKKPLSKSRTVAAAATGAGTSVVSIGVGTVTAIAPAVPIIGDIADVVGAHPGLALIAMGVVVLAVCSVIAYARYSDRMSGVH